MARIETSAPGTTGLEVSSGPGGGLFLSVHTSHGHLMTLLTSQEARRAIGIMSSLLMSHRESNPSQSGKDAAPFPRHFTR